MTQTSLRRDLIIFFVIGVIVVSGIAALYFTNEANGWLDEFDTKLFRWLID